LTIAGVLILFLSLFLMYMQNKNQKDKNAILTQKNAEITKQNEDLALANQDLEKYAYIISHDLREPLRNISGFTTLIKRKLKNLNQDDEDLNEYMDFVVNNTNQMNELLIELLEYSKLSFKNQEIETVNLTEVVQDVLISQKAEIAAANVEIILPEFPEISYNSKQMFNIFDNLINNAIKYKATSRNLIIEINIADKDAFYEFSIKDNGIGVEAEFFEKIFTIFQRLHDRGKYTGSGIGLATCRKIIESRGGKIWVESTFDVGSTFYFTVPKIIQTLG
jgi:light-regulated signal transduction histidine kinase (bacteriophytochrome)